MFFSVMWLLEDEVILIKETLKKFAFEMLGYVNIMLTLNKNQTKISQKELPGVN